MRKIFEEYGNVMLKILIALFMIGTIIGLAVYRPWEKPDLSDKTSIQYIAINGNLDSYTGDYTDSGASVTVTNPENDYAIYYKDGVFFSRTSMPRFVNAGTYTVAFRIEAKGFKNVTDSITITIHKKDWYFTAPKANTLTYNGSYQKLASEGVISKEYPNEDISNGRFEYKLGEDGLWSTTMPEAKNAGTYDLYYRIPADQNHNAYNGGKIAITINKATNNLYISPSSGEVCINSSISTTIVNPGAGNLSSTSSASSVATSSISGSTLNMSSKKDGSAVITVNAASNINYNAASTKYNLTVKNCTYSISYDLDGGTMSNYKTSYDQKSDYTLPTPTRQYYDFTGWTGSNGTTPQKSVTIYAGSVGNKSYKANWKRSIVKDYSWQTSCAISSWNEKTQYKVNYSYYQSKTCTKDEDYTCTQGRNSNSCGCGINYNDPVSGYCNDVQTSTSVVKSCSASSGACPGGTKVSCYYQGGGKYQKIVYTRKASRWYYYSSCTRTRQVDYECGSTKNGTTDWQDNTNAPSGTNYVSIASTRQLYQCMVYAG